MSITSRLNTLAAAGSGEPIGWALEFYDSSNTDSVEFRAGTGNATNIYAVGWVSNNPQNIHVGVDLDGNVNFQKCVNDNNVQYMFGCTMSGSDLIVTGRNSGPEQLLLSYASNGSLNWSHRINQNATAGAAVAVVGSNIYTCGYSDWSAQGSYDWSVVQYNSSGALQSMRVAGRTSFDFAQAVKYDATNNRIIVFGQYYNFGYYNSAIVRFSTTTSLIDQVGPNPNGGGDETYDDGVVLNGTYIAVGKCYDGSQTKGVLTKYNSSLSLTSEVKYVVTGASYNRIEKISEADSNGDYYLLFEVQGLYNGRDMLVAKIDSSGTVSWANSISSNNANDITPYAITLLDDDTLAICCRQLNTVTSKYSGVIFKIPTDGSTGSGSDYTVQSETLTGTSHRTGTLNPSLSSQGPSPSGSYNPYSSTTNKSYTTSLTEI